MNTQEATQTVRDFTASLLSQEPDTPPKITDLTVAAIFTLHLAASARRRTHGHRKLNNAAAYLLTSAAATAISADLEEAQ